MKKISKLILALFTTVCVLSGCAGFDANVSGETVIFRGIVTKIENAGFLVTPEESAEELKSSDSFYISSKHLSEDINLQVGDKVEITYSGYIEETYPASLEKITDVKLVDSATKEQSAENVSGDYPPCVMIDGEWRIFRDIESEDTSIPEQVKNFNAEVKEILDDGTMRVSYISMPDGFTHMSEGDYVVSMDNIRGEVNEGDTVTIWFDGNVEETEPAQIGFAHRIEKVTE